MRRVFNPKSFRRFRSALHAIALVLILLILLGVTTTLLVSSCRNCFAQFVDTSSYGIPKDGTTECSEDWEDFNDSIPNNCLVRLPKDAKYYLNAPVVFTKTMRILGAGATFIAGPGVGNNPLLTFEGDRTVVENIQIYCNNNHTDGNNDNFQDAADALTLNKRRGICMEGDYSVCRFIKTSECVVGIAFEHADYGTIDTCWLNNETVKSGSTATNNYHCGVYAYYSDYLKISDCTIDGHGQNILVSCSFDLTIMNNACLNASNNGIYVSSGGDDNIYDNRVSSFDKVGIKVRDSHHNIHHNRIMCNITGGCVAGMNITGNGNNDGGGFNGHATLVQANIITGNPGKGINIGVQDDYHMKDVHLRDNIIHIDDSPTQAGYGIHFSSTASDGATSIGNVVSGGQSFGLIMSVESGYKHKNMLVMGNQMTGGSNDAFSLSDVFNSLIIGNNGKNRATGRTGLLLDNGTYNMVFSNNFGDDQDTATQKYGIEGRNSEGYNWLIDNYTFGVITNEYYNIDNSTLIIDPND